MVGQLLSAEACRPEDAEALRAKARDGRNQLHVSRDAQAGDAREMGVANAGAFPFRTQSFAADHAFRAMRNVEDATGHFIDVASVLGERLGPALFQLPPDFKRDVVRLKDFLAILKGRIRVAFEFRNESWFDDEVFAALADGEAALCIAETKKLKTPVRRTAPYVYLRLRMGDYDDAGLATWARHVDELGKEANEIYAFFKHEDRAPELALKFRAMLKDAL